VPRRILVYGRDIYGSVVLYSIADVELDRRPRCSLLTVLVYVHWLARVGRCLLSWLSGEVSAW
jgi:hypothetical protein